MDNAGTPVNVIAELAGHGVTFAIDDFGTGYSNLGYLQRFPLHRLKIDQSFIRGVTTNHGDAAIVRAVLGLARNLGLKVLAEGVEKIEQLEFLRAEGCQEVQGYLIGKPVPADQFARLLALYPPVIDVGRDAPDSPNRPELQSANL